MMALKQSQQLNTCFAKPAKPRLYLSQFQVQEQPLKEFCPLSPAQEGLTQGKKLKLSSQSVWSSSSQPENLTKKMKARVKEQKLDALREQDYATVGVPRQTSNCYIFDKDPQDNPGVLSQVSPKAPCRAATFLKKASDQPKSKGRSNAPAVKKCDIKVYQSRPSKVDAQLYSTHQDDKIADERLLLSSSSQHRPRNDTPKFSDYYSIQCKKPMGSSRSRSLAKPMEKQQERVGVGNRDGQAGKVNCMSSCEGAVQRTGTTLVGGNLGEQCKGKKVKKLKKADIKFSGLKAFDLNPKKVINCQSFKASTKRPFLCAKGRSRKLQHVSSPQIPQKVGVANEPESPGEEGFEGEDVSERHSRQPMERLMIPGDKKMVPNFQPKYGLKKRKNQSLSSDLDSGQYVYSSLSGAVSKPQLEIFDVQKSPMRADPLFEYTKTLSVDDFDMPDLSQMHAKMKGGFDLQEKMNVLRGDLGSGIATTIPTGLGSGVVSGISTGFRQALGEGVLLAVMEFLELEEVAGLVKALMNKRNEALMQKVVYKRMYQNKPKSMVVSELKSFLLLHFNVPLSLQQRRGFFQHLLSTASPSDCEIRKDIPRTFPRSQSFLPRHQQDLFKVLHALATYAPSIGYVQGFNFILGNLIRVFDGQPEQVFYLFAGMLQQLRLERLYESGLSGLKELNFVCQVLASNYKPEMALKLAESCVGVDYVTSQWFITLFSHDLGVEEFIGICALMAMFGKKVLVEVAMSMLEELRKPFLELEMEEGLEFLKGFREEDRWVMQSRRVLERAVTEEVVESQLVCRLLALNVKARERKVLLVKDKDREETLLKVLPNPPEESLEAEESGIEDDFQYDYGRNRRYQCNNASALDILQDDCSNNSFEAYVDREKLCKTQRNPTRNDCPRQSLIKRDDNLSRQSSSIESSYESRPYYMKEWRQGGSSSSSIYCQEGVVEESAHLNLHHLQEEPDSLSSFHCSQRSSRIQSFRPQQHHNHPAPFSPAAANSQNSEDILESEQKAAGWAVEGIGGAGIAQKILNLENLQVGGSESHNVSIDEFQCHLKRTQRTLAQAKLINFPSSVCKHSDIVFEEEEAASRASDLVKSWNLNKPCDQPPHRQFDLNRQGSHLNSPVFQQSNRSNTLILEKTQGQPIQKINCFQTRKMVVQENKNPNEGLSKIKKSGPNGNYQIFANKAQEQKRIKEILRKSQKSKNNWSAHQESTSFGGLDDLIKARSPPKKAPVLCSRKFGMQLQMSPKAAATKQSAKISTHQGDNFLDESDMTWVITPKESLVGRDSRAK